jgi:hypothetical protein
MGETDEDLWRKCIAGDADAFGVLFDRHADAVFRYCLVPLRFLARRGGTRLDHLLGGVADSGTGSRPEKDTLLPWLLGVATNANRNRARGSRRHAEFLSTGCRTRTPGTANTKQTMRSGRLQA